jgi:Holliday junction DNA helicase RuvB
MPLPEEPRRVFDPASEEGDELDRTLRPRSFEEFVGQPRVVENLRIHLRAADARGEAPDHILLTGLPGLGKTTLANLVALVRGVSIRVTSGPALEKPRDLVGVLSNLQRGEVLFIDEIHRLPAALEEILYSAMEDFRVDLTIDSGPHARILNLRLHPFTLVGATTREGLLSAPLRARFGVHERLEPYAAEELEVILDRSARVLSVGLDSAARGLLAHRARGIPRIANRLLRRVRDLAQVRGEGRVTEPIAREGLAMLGVDEEGLEEIDRQILRAILRFGGGPVGLKTVAMAVGEESDTIEEVYEPFLIREGFLQKTPRGRLATPRARKLLHVRGSEQGRLL